MKIAVVAPGRTLPAIASEKLGVITKEHPQYAHVDMVIHPQCFSAKGHFAGSDEQRAQALLEVANDPTVDAIWFARGGYGACRIVDRFMAGLADAARTKTYLGYSDTGYLLGAIASKGIGRAVHGPMVADGLRKGGEVALRRVLDWFVSGSTVSVEANQDEGHKRAAFNISILASLVATPHMPDLKDYTLYLEDVEEHLYAIDRAIYTCFASGRLSNLRGIRLGRVSAIPENDVPFGENAEQIVSRWCQIYGIPFLGSADIGHDVDNKIVEFGR